MGTIGVTATAQEGEAPVRVLPSDRRRALEARLPRPDQAPLPCNRVSNSARVEQAEALAEAAQAAVLERVEAIAEVARAVVVEAHFRAWAAAARQE